MRRPGAPPPPMRINADAPPPREVDAVVSTDKRGPLKPAMLSADGSALDADIQKKLSSRLDANKQNGLKVYLSFNFFSVAFSFLSFSLFSLSLFSLPFSFSCSLS